MRICRAREARQRRFDQGVKSRSFEAIPKAFERGNGRSSRFHRTFETDASKLPGRSSEKMVINGLNSGAHVFMADFEDATSPSWPNMVEGQVNLFDAVRGTIHYVPTRNRETVYALCDQPRSALRSTTRSAPSRTSRHGGWSGDARLPVRFWRLHFQ